MMTIDSYLKSSEYLTFIDEALRRHACHAVDQYFSVNDKKADKAQIHSISSAIRAGGLPTLKNLAERQVGKDTSTENQTFWRFMLSLFVFMPGQSNPGFSLYSSVHTELSHKGLLQPDAPDTERVQARRIRKSNAEMITAVISDALEIYFEHFTCHYFYRTRHGATQ